MISRTIIFLVAALAVLLVTSFAHAKLFTSNGYEVELLWKVKRDYLKMWGSIEEGKKCHRLKVYAHFINNRYDRTLYATLNTVINQEHLPSDRSTFKGQDKIGSNRYKNGWIVDKLSVTCLKVQPQ